MFFFLFNYKKSVRLLLTKNQFHSLQTFVFFFLIFFQGLNLHIPGGAIIFVHPYGKQIPGAKMPVTRANASKPSILLKPDWNRRVVLLTFIIY